MERVFWLFPIVFMIHEMEEIIGFRLWFEKNFDLVKNIVRLKNYTVILAVKVLQSLFLKNI